MRILVIVQVAVSLLLIVSILLQSRGSGMSVSLGGGNYYAKRGFEKFLLVDHEKFNKYDFYGYCQ